MRWYNELQTIEAFDSCAFEPALVDALQDATSRLAPRPLQVATPSFQAYATSEISQCCSSAFPVFSITGSACALNCKHCQTKILEPMIPAENPEALERKVRELAETKSLRGFLISGGSSRRNEINYGRYLPAVSRLKRCFPAMQVAVHTALLDEERARALADAGVDVAMIDLIGHDATIRDVYHLNRPVADFEKSLAALTRTAMRVVPHIVIGLHFGQVLGENRAIDICSSYPIDALVLVVVMPVHAVPGRFQEPPLGDVVTVMQTARSKLHDGRVMLGCARPHGLYRRSLDAYAVMSGLDSVAFPAEGAITLARRIGRPLVQNEACCSMHQATRQLIEATS